MATVLDPPVLTPETVISDLPNAFSRGRESQDLFFFESTTSTFPENGIDFEIRKCPALLHKPHLPTPHFNASVSPDPFAPPYPAGLLIGELHGEDDEKYVIMLNKYRLVLRIILTNRYCWKLTKRRTKRGQTPLSLDHKSQTTPPLPPDLVIAYQLLVSARKAGTPFFAFFNCGDRSGASQNHKHLQLLPVAADGPPVERLAKAQNVDVEATPFSIDRLPYAQYVRRLPTSLPSAPTDTLYETLTTAFLQLLDLAVLAIRHDPNEHPRGPPSFNLILTLSHMHLIPRSQEKYVLTQTGEPMSINSVGFAGMLLVKSEEEAEAVRKEGILSILRRVLDRF
ncbi:hypothetical protein BS47DRAFT_782668 [Hydnum rufescens UP504]|uniref:ATP adenylyltransferase n=1 Tax=Hydnum rufescens UP504 TaxID=1448309 RepID=A0A9P6B0Z8_9AGAM|nr:hypothetical protein BS47DRAFT_782668 [Hydnum rufescens UP504]